MSAPPQTRIRSLSHLVNSLSSRGHCTTAVQIGAPSRCLHGPSSSQWPSLRRPRNPEPHSRRCVVGARFNSMTAGSSSGSNGGEARRIRPYRAPGDDKLTPHSGPRAAITHQIYALKDVPPGEKVVIAGWIHRKRRARSDLHFYTVRGNSGAFTQLKVTDPDLAAALNSYPYESVIQVEGTCQARVTAGNRPHHGDMLDIHVDKVTLLNAAKEQLPLAFDPYLPVSEDVRAKYRYLDLRTKEAHQRMKLRARTANLCRRVLQRLGFTEIETPILLHPSPEGAREFLVPTRNKDSSGSPLFYALQQSPQQPKQLLVAGGGFDKYFQLAKCFRDEDGRKDRQPEFTQLDFEMAFVDTAPSTTAGAAKNGWGMGGQQVKEAAEELMRCIWQEASGKEIKEFKVMPYEVAMDVYGSDKPDTRFEMFCLPIGYYPALTDTSLDKILLDQSQYTVEWMVTSADYAKHLDVEKLVGSNHFVHHIKVTPENQYSWPSESPLTQSMQLEIDQDLPGGAKPGDIIWLSQRKKIAEGGWTHLGRLRVELVGSLVSQGHMTLTEDPHFVWITQFPLFTRADPDKEHLSKGRYASTHHPFTAPMYEDLEDLKAGKVDRVRGQHYDLVLNGQELGGGSVRIHDAGLQEYVMREVLELNDNEVSRFDHLLDVLQSGAPPHAGMAVGFDRLIAILADCTSIREVIAFPKTGSGTDPVFKSPCKVDDEVLREYGLKAVASQD